MCLAKSRRLWRRGGLQGLVGERIQASEVGTPQGGPLSPLLANILLLPNSTLSWNGGDTALHVMPMTGLFLSKASALHSG